MRNINSPIKNNSKDATELPKAGTVQLPEKALRIVVAESDRRSVSGEPGDSYKAVAGEYVINWHNHISKPSAGEGAV